MTIYLLFENMFILLCFQLGFQFLIEFIHKFLEFHRVALGILKETVLVHFHFLWGFLVLTNIIVFYRPVHASIGFHLKFTREISKLVDAFLAWWVYYAHCCFMIYVVLVFFFLFKKSTFNSLNSSYFLKILQILGIKPVWKVVIYTSKIKQFLLYQRSFLLIIQYIYLLYLFLILSKFFIYFIKFSEWRLNFSLDF